MKVACHTHAAAEALRDFFLAAGSAELRGAYERLADAGADPPPVEDWDELEFAFNRLFVGPRSPVAPPYASVYLDGQALLMGSTTLTIRHMYYALGLTSPWENSLPDDHLGLELDAWRQMQCAASAVESEELRELQDFLQDHLRKWVPLFAARVREAGDLPPALLFVVSLLEDVAHLEGGSDMSRERGGGEA